jgi:hypothetical protein
VLRAARDHVWPATASVQATWIVVPATATDGTPALTGAGTARVGSQVLPWFMLTRSLRTPTLDDVSCQAMTTTGPLAATAGHELGSDGEIRRRTGAAQVDPRSRLRWYRTAGWAAFG